MKKKLTIFLTFILLVLSGCTSTPSSEVSSSINEPSSEIPTSSEIISSEESSDEPSSSEEPSITSSEPSSEPSSSEEPSSETPSSSEEPSSEPSSEEPSSEPSSSEEPSSEPSSSEESSSEEPTPFTLDAPVLSLDNNTGLASWTKVENAEYYRYYINDGNTYTTTLNSLVIPSGSVISVCAESSLEHIRSSSWSNPVTYFETVKESEYVNIYFHNTSLAPVTILKGAKYTPTIPSKTNYTFEGWYLDPYYQQSLDSDYRFNKNTILYANFVAEDWMNDVTYFIKANSSISSEVISSTTSSSGWRFIPLRLDNELTKEYGKRIFSAVVSVNNNSAAYLIMDGIHDDAGRTYYKNGSSDFAITSTGTYKICFSVEYAWNSLNSTAIKLSNSSSSIYDDNQYPSFVIETATQLEQVVVSVDKDTETASWNIVTNAAYYEYVIDNGEIRTTTSNNIPLYQGSQITVRACPKDNTYLASRWSIPVYQEISHYPNSIFVYFYGSDRPSIEVPYGGKVEKPINNPTKTGYLFENWYKNISYSTLFDFDQPLYENTIIYAKFNVIDTVKFELYTSNKVTKLADFDISSQYGYNEYVATYTVDSDLSVYVKSVEYNTWYGPYTMSSKGEYTMYFSDEHKWDVDTTNERNAYWSKNGSSDEEYTIYFSNNKYWSKVYYYIWQSSSYDTAWPGANMTFVRQNSHGEDIYKCTFDTKYTNIIFSNGSGEQTIDISLEGVSSGTGYYLTNKSNNKWDVSTYTYVD